MSKKIYEIIIKNFLNPMKTEDKNQKYIDVLKSLSLYRKDLQKS